MTRLGFVGVGKWAQKLAESFRACGAEIVAHDRKGLDSWPKELPGFGGGLPWREQIEYEKIDAIIAAAPPEVTTEVALACAAAGKPVMATKPLFDHPATICAPFYVDFWRLWAQAHMVVKERPPNNHFCFVLNGSGPRRAFPGIFDYGPHAMAAVHDLGYPRMASSYFYESDDRGDRVNFAMNAGCDRMLSVSFGNGYDRAFRCIFDQIETPLAIGDEPKDQILQRFCQSFLNDISEGFVDTRLLELSRRGMAELRRIREMATASPGTR